MTYIPLPAMNYRDGQRRSTEQLPRLRQALTKYESKEMPPERVAALALPPLSCMEAA